MNTEQGREALAKLRGKNAADLSAAEYYWLVGELESLYDHVDVLEREAQQRASLRARLSSLPPAEGDHG